MAISAQALVVIWLLACISSYTMDGFIHIFPIVATGMMLPRVILGRKPRT